MPVGLLLCCLLLQCAAEHAVAASHRKTSVSTVHPPSASGSELPSSEPLPCQILLPKSLPGFTRMPPLPKFLVGLALQNALEEADCRAEARALQFELYGLGGAKATQALMHHLRGLQKDRSTDWRVSAEALASALQLLATEQPDQKRTPRSLLDMDCENEREESVHNVVQVLPAVGTYYNVGTALYYAFHNCPDKAKERGQEGAIDLGYDLLMTMAGLSGGPAGVAISAALKPALKIGVQRLVQYYYQEREAITVEPGTSLLGISSVSEWKETTTPEAVSPASSYWWTLF